MNLPPQIVRAPSFANVQAGNVATMDFPLDGRRIRKLYVNADESGGGGLVSLVSNLRIKVGGRTQREFSPAQLSYLVNLNGYGVFGSNPVSPPESNRFQIPFAEEWRRTAIEEDSLAWGTGGFAQKGSIQIEADILPGTTGIVLDAKMEVDYPKDESGAAIGLGEIMKVVRTQMPIAQSGIFTYQSIPRVDKLHRMHFFSSLVTRVEVWADNVPLFDMTKSENYEMLERLGFNPNQNVFSVVFDRHQRLNEAIDLSRVGEFRVDVHTTGSPTPFPMLYEVRGPVR